MLHGQLAHVPTPSIETSSRSEPRPWERPPESAGAEKSADSISSVSAEILSECVTWRSLLLGGKLRCSRSSVPQHVKEEMAVLARVTWEYG